MGKETVAGKVAVITGGASGIGRALAQRFGGEGARVALLDFDAETLANTAAQLRETGVEVFEHQCDVTDEDGCSAAIAAVCDHFGGIDLLFNNAGITQRSPFVETDLAVYRRVMAVNFFGTLHCTKPALASLIERRGQIIVTSSIAGFAPILGRTGYCASKHALHGFFGVLRAEVAPMGVNVLIICPGFTKTQLQTRALDGDGGVTSHPQSRVGKQSTPDQVAAAVYRAVCKRKRLLVLSRVGKTTQFLMRVAPGWYERIMRKKLGSELERNQ